MKKLLLIIIFIISSHFLFANAGTPLMWFGMLHLILLNGLIGVVESWILRKMQIKHTFEMIVVANYVSMFFGMYFIAPFVVELFGYPEFWKTQEYLFFYKNEFSVFFLGLFVAFISTLIIEFPFYAFITTKENRKQTIKGLLLANVITYVVMTFFYYQTVTMD